jgi:DNA processing protein
MKENFSSKENERINIAIQTRDKLAARGISFCTVQDDIYPTELRSLTDRPAILYYKGNIQICNTFHNIAVIGSRQCSENGMKLSYEVGKIVAKNNINVVNGLALGCDTAALRGAIDSGGKCVVFLPCGLDDVQPKANQKLAEEIISHGGCIISEYAPDTKPAKYNYVQRDRLQSGVSQGVIVIEAEKSSGTMHTAQFAINQYKRLACYYHALLKFSSGNQYLAEVGKASVLAGNDDLKNFVAEVAKEAKYEQMSLF